MIHNTLPYDLTRALVIVNRTFVEQVKIASTFAI